MSRETWFPFQSRATKDICQHLTDAEKIILQRRAHTYGRWVAVTLAVPLVIVFLTRSWIALLAVSPVLVAHLIGIGIWHEKTKAFLSSTQWATAQGYTPETFRLYGLRRRHRCDERTARP